MSNTYNPNIPQASDLQDVSQGDILNNFTSLQNVYGTDHWPLYPSTANDGFHIDVTLPSFPNDYSDPAHPNQPLKPSGSITPALRLFTQIVAGEPALFGITTDGTTAPISPVYLAATTGYFQVGGILVNWGLESISTSSGFGAATITYAQAFQATVAPYYLSASFGSLTGGQGATTIMYPLTGNVNTKATINFYTPNSPSGNKNIYWLAIGPA